MRRASAGLGSDARRDAERPDLPIDAFGYRRAPMSEAVWLRWRANIRRIEPVVRFHAGLSPELPLSRPPNPQLIIPGIIPEEK